MTGLIGKRVLVIGGSSGIGLGVARAALAEGAEVTIASSNAARGAAAVAGMGGGAAAQLDVADEAAVRMFFSGGPQWSILPLPPLTGAWSAMPISPTPTLMPFADCSTCASGARWRWPSMARPMWCPAAPSFSPTVWPRIAPKRGWPWRRRWPAQSNIWLPASPSISPRCDVNGVCPGAIRTEAWDELPADFRKFQEDRLATQLVPRVGETAEAAEAYLYLMRCAYVTGQTLRVEGGWSLGG